MEEIEFIADVPLLGFKVMELWNDGVPRSNFGRVPWHNLQLSAQCPICKTSPNIYCGIDRGDGCGIYATSELRDALIYLSALSPKRFHHILTIVELYGKIVQGTRGYRAEHARIIAQISHGDSVPASLSLGRAFMLFDFNYRGLKIPQELLGVDTSSIIRYETPRFEIGKYPTEYNRYTRPIITDSEPVICLSLEYIPKLSYIEGVEILDLATAKDQVKESWDDAYKYLEAKT